MTDRAPRILAFAGSTRTGSYNKKLARIAADGARDAGAEVTYIDLRDYPLPVYDGDYEEEHGLPDNGRTLKDMFIAGDGFMIASPENNSSFSAVFKNTMDWLSRPVKGYPPYECFDGKVAVLMAASTGNFGGIRGLLDVRKMLAVLRVTVLPDQVLVPRAKDAFDDSDRLKDDRQQDAVRALGRTLTDYLKRLGG
ncbi:MAG: NAD(P)H-dependent oxidoreductase [candidate division Zixibacteria bacterium]|jgi:NAD(P)H-dependent FMN reductase|nr:NAD(P)H-dependent oxidoreductase [candidate division Zixibacteria bacterium]